MIKTGRLNRLVTKTKLNGDQGNDDIESIDSDSLDDNSFEFSPVCTDAKFVERSESQESKLNM